MPEVNPLLAKEAEFGIPAVLKLLRGYYGLTQDQMAGKLGLNRGHYSRVETGYRALGFQYWAKLCDMSQLSMGELYILIYDSIPSERRCASLSLLDTEEILSTRAAVLRYGVQRRGAEAITESEMKMQLNAKPNDSNGPSD